jgi:NAD(P)-dependent dehydrogenase (short-subunit alcohol dehydrogenase family)/acyl carrier protein
MGRRISTVQALEEMGVQITIARADVSDRMAMKQLFAQFGAALPPLRGVIHAAGTNANQTVADLNFDTWRDVLKPKVDGAWILHNLTTQIPLDFFVCFSSAASVWGSQGMAAYAAANHFLDQLAHYRRAHQLPALTVNWGWWAGDGIATDEQLSLFAKVGMSTMPTEKALEALAQLIELDVTQEIVANVDWSVFAPIYASRRERPFLSQIQIPAAEKTVRPETETMTEKNSLLQQLQALSSPEKQREMLTDYVRQVTAEVMGFDKSRVLNTREGFFKMGMDSLMTVQLRTRLESTLGCSLPPTIAFEYPTISQLAGYILQDVLHLPEKPAAVETTNRSESSQGDPELDALSDENLLDLLDDELAKVDNLTK